MKVYCCQYDIAWENRELNYAKIRALLKTTTLERGSLLVLPEMFSSGFSMNVRAISENANGLAMSFLSEICRELGIFAVAGLVAKTGDGMGLNEAVAVSPLGEVLARYVKIHPFTLGGELKHYTRGKQIFSFQWNDITVTPFICYDLRFPEVFRGAVRQGAEMFVVIANWPDRRERHWTTLLEARAIENLAYVVGVNRSGKDPQHTYSGRSMIFDPHGRTLADAGSGEGLIAAEIHRQAVTEWRKEFAALQDMHWEG
jgi:predicted amidohydrolase